MKATDTAGHPGEYANGPGDVSRKHSPQNRPAADEILSDACPGTIGDPPVPESQPPALHHIVPLPTLTGDEIAQLRAFFQILDQWDQEQSEKAEADEKVSSLTTAEGVSIIFP